MTEHDCLEGVPLQEAKKHIHEVIDEATLEQQAMCFKVLGDLNRVKIVHILRHYQRLCVNEISELIDATVATTSHHLIMLKKSGIIQSEKEGKHVMYSLSNNIVVNLMDLSHQLEAKCPKCGQIHTKS